jgi:tetratricopeptide (TPR) repeat protein
MKNIFFCCLFLIISLISNSQENQKCKKLLIKGNELIDNKKPNYKKALKLYSKAIKIDPKYYQAMYNRARLYDDLGQHQLAIDDLTQCINLIPSKENKKIAQAYTNRGVAYRNLEMLDKALLDYNKAIEIDNTVPQAYYNRAWVYKLKNNMKSSCEDLNKSLELGMKDVDGLKKDCH